MSAQPIAETPEGYPIRDEALAQLDALEQESGRPRHPCPPVLLGEFLHRADLESA